VDTRLGSCHYLALALSFKSTFVLISSPENLAFVTMINFNLSASLNVLRILFKPGICLPHHSVPNFGELPIPLDKALNQNGRNVEIKAVVLDKDDCFAYPDSDKVYEPYSVGHAW
jgi:hypothetical protein